MKKVTLEVNGKSVSKEIPDHTLLSVFLRENLNLTYPEEEFISFKEEDQDEQR